MLRMKTDALKKIIRKEIDTFSSNYRCHEGARLIAGKLREFGGDVNVKDGGVIYDTSYFLKCFEDILDPSILEGSSEEEKRELVKESRTGEERRKISILHSWCEFRDDSDNPIVIDWHAYLKLSSYHGIENNLIVDNKSNLPHTYIPFGIAVGKWIIFKKFPPYAIRLRM